MFTPLIWEWTNLDGLKSLIDSNFDLQSLLQMLRIFPRNVWFWIYTKAAESIDWTAEKGTLYRYLD